MKKLECAVTRRDFLATTGVSAMGAAYMVAGRAASAGQAGLKVVLASDFSIQESIWNLSISPDGLNLAAGTQEGQLVLASIDSHGVKIREKTVNAHLNAISEVQFSPTSDQLVSASFDYTAQVWSVPDGQPVTVLGSHSGEVTAVAYAPKGNWIATADWNGKIVLWDRSSWSSTQLQPAGTPDDRINSLEFTRVRDNTLVAGSKKKSAVVHERTLGNWHAHAKAHAAEVTGVATAPDGRGYVTTLRKDKKSHQAVYAWRFGSSGKPRSVLKLQNVTTYSPTYHPADPDIIFFTASDGTVHMWNLQTGVDNVFCAHNPVNPPTCLAVSSIDTNGDVYIGVGHVKGGFSLWRHSGTSQLPQLIHGVQPDLIEASVFSIMFSPVNPRVFATGHERSSASDPTVRTWNITADSDDSRMTLLNASPEVKAEMAKLGARERWTVTGTIDEQGAHVWVSGEHGYCDIESDGEYLIDGAGLEVGEYYYVKAWRQERMTAWRRFMPSYVGETITENFGLLNYTTALGSVPWECQ